MPDENPSRSKLERLAYVAASIAGASALLYVLGVITLWVQIINYRNTQDFYTSAFAVATVPNPVTVGLGVKTIVDTLWAAIVATYSYVLYFVGFILAVVGAEYWTSRRGKSTGSDQVIVTDNEAQHENESPELEATEPERSGVEWRKLLSNYWVVVPFFNAIFIAFQALQFLRGATLWNEAIGNACILCGAYTGVMLIWIHLDNVRWALAGLVIILASAYISSIIAAFSEPPSLPIIRFWGQEVSEVASDSMFYVLNHSEGYWSVLDSEGNMLAIPDKDSTHIQLVERDNLEAWRVLMEPDATGSDKTVLHSMEHVSASGGGFLGSVDVEGIDLSYLDLYEEDRMAGARGATLLYANLQAAVLRRADLRGANLHGAQVRAADLRCANLQGTVGLEQVEIDSAEGDSTTLLPSTLAMPKHWPSASQDEMNRCEDFWRTR